MKNLVVTLVLLFSTLSFSQKVVTSSSFPVQISVSGENIKMSIPKNVEVYIYKVGVKDPINHGKYGMGFETDFKLTKGKYTIKVIKDGKNYTNKFSI